MMAANQQTGHNGKKDLGRKVKQGLFKAKNPAQLQRHEDDVRARMSAASEAFRKAVVESQALRAEYFNFQLPKVVRLLKDCADELDLGVQYHLTRYAFMYESAVVTEGTTLAPATSPDDVGLKTIFEGIDNRTDFKTFMQNYAVARNAPKGPRREGLYEEGYVPTLPPHVQASQNALAAQNAQQREQQSQQPQQPPQPQTANGGGGGGGGGGAAATPVAAAIPPPADPYQSQMVPASTGATFGVDLGEQLARDSTEIPKVVTKCAEAIEAYGLDSMGIYRLSGTTSKVQALKAALDKDVDGVNVMDEQWSSDINVISSALKLWFRELPEPLLTYGLYNGFMEAARYDNDRLRHIRLHEQVNELPDPNYATLKYFMGHLDRVRRKEGVNQMSASNLSIVFGPTLLGAPPEEGGLNLEHMNYQCKAIETILEKYQEIFVEEDDDGGEKASAAGPAPASGSA
ncbi:hypothetical protein VHUM_02586 [Vanrija humicola]|uniref:Rho-GAP domain-containing protein n=1 Tax=Vanrija humicola TaxID=5417 RepID=A0A7D8V0J2_VANHU|nr:hypothetical protein VHUM_02586 [Vanrija humicola]